MNRYRAFILQKQFTPVEVTAFTLEEAHQLITENECEEVGDVIFGESEITELVSVKNDSEEVSDNDK